MGYRMNSCRGPGRGARWSLLPLVLVILCALCGARADQDEDIPHNEVKNWALKFGVDLWEFGRHFTKTNQIQNTYHDWDVEVARKDGLMLIREMAAEVKNLMDFKMSAVMRIMDSAEQAALPGSARSPAQYYDARRLNVFGPDGRPAEGSRRLQLVPSRHFDHLSVNISHSAILMPPFVDEYDTEVQNQIAWSEHLDPLFANNYESDPALSWQYFGSSTGFLRRFPAISWPPEDGRSHHARDFYDFRASPWFVEAATSPKDVVILLDASSAAGGRRGALARATAAAILDSLGPNDFVNIYTFSDVTEELVPCFKNMLVQATQENVRELKYALENSPETSNEANFTAALTVAFEILHKYNRTGQGCQCNQATMLVAGGASSAPRDVFRAHNWPHMPVRVFTFLAGADAPGAAHMQWIACSNKGFYARINNHDEIRDKVFNFVSVMARPMVMYQADHPIQWSPAYVGGRGEGLADDGQGQLMTSVTTPIFDRRNHTQREANLLGVVGTDVPIDQIKKLVPPYKLGANGYSFIINNNGHVLYHPDLRPLYNNEEYTETLRPLYSSVDITEMELSEQEATPRENHSLLLDLRNEMIEQKEGDTEVAVKVHYEEMRRVATRRQRYFYGPVEGTPFSLAVVLPDGYGMYELLAEQELRHSPINVTEYFKGDNWRVHPDWVYCEYNSATEVNFQTAEERLLHFLARAGRPGWKWMSLRPRSPSRSEHHHFIKKQEKDSYYCDKTLLQSLVRDAMVMDGLETRLMHPGRSHPIATLMALLSRQGYQMFGVTFSFVATRSGLLRWTEHVPRSPDSTEPHFSEIYHKAFDAPWYKRAVDHHSVEPESFVFSVPFSEGGGAGGEPLVRATHAVFVEHRGHRAPAAVVGLHFQLQTLVKHFVNITSACTGSGNCKKNCASMDLDCYILDDNGFVILSEEYSHTGQFFGQIDGTIMDSLVQDRIYRKVPLFDYQGRCPNGKNPYSAKGTSLTSSRPIYWFVTWLWRLAAMWVPLWDEAQGRAQSYPQDESYGDPTYADYEEEENYPPEEVPPAATVPTEAPPPPPQQPPAALPPQQPPPPPPGPAPPAGGGAGVRACDKRTDLYVLQAERLNMSQPLKGKLTNCHVTGCERPFSVQKIPHSNLILLVVDTLCPCGVKQLGTGARELPPAPCRPGAHARRRPHKCINYHPEEIEIQLCGGAGGLAASVPALLLAALLALLARWAPHT